MTFIFKGFFARDAQALDAAQKQWSDCRTRDIGVKFLKQFPPDFQGWTKQFPAVTFVYIEVECFGGRCDYHGFVCRNGDNIFENTRPETLEESNTNLLALLAYLGVQTTYFEPLTRGYFD
jgi:hypothetical protein